ncbi:acyltransferase family protein [Egibacter rhizosphaerae]|nr:acyltransferase [Egibacter rhizosphaerae]
MAGELVRQVARATPADRNRYVDFLRVTALGAVVVGHWIIPVFVPANGDFAVHFIMTQEPWTRWATWLFQVMPVFFIVGGYANAVAWTRAEAAGESAVAWASRRARRLLRPLAPVVVAWVVLVAVGQAVGVEARWLTFASQSALVPAWFLAVYVVVTVAVPITLRLEERLGLALPAVLAALVAGTDALALGASEEVQWANFVWVWFAVHQLGLRWHRRGLVRPVGGIALLVAGVASLGVLVTLAGYPVDMVAEENGRTNATPPSLAMLGLAVAQLGLVALLRPPLERALARPGLWGAVALVGSRIMTVFLWHMTAMIAVAAGLAAAGWLPLRDALDWGWWSSRPVWMLMCAVVLAVLVALLGRAERVPRNRSVSPTGAVGTTAGALVTAVAVGTLSAGGVYDADGPLGLALWPLVALLAALAALGVLERDRPTDEVSG